MTFTDTVSMDETCFVNSIKTLCLCLHLLPLGHRTYMLLPRGITYMLLPRDNILKWLKRSANKAQKF